MITKTGFIKCMKELGIQHTQNGIYEYDKFFLGIQN